ncbi:hypothetical protein L198_03148 [Cryptococcus wingfieldii CBS 7118]|uniref:Major facilitator superfamily (MFS) profile domain-containing protein n=1 Tax=Cryptococcus wingfieldii CBS 7118 TaxID=1295528 RepID=A0A1E3JIV9_9TREE|nr:hypothetical protein L198_03148 [Cryptococcus wingfieldii CBS 7118]ODO00821.1 hypothetical protein L198_03148 [Cryptococcus wingfieldii CBS 7118]
MATQQNFEQPVQRSGESALSLSIGPSTPLPEPQAAPWGAKWRSSSWFITLVVALGTSTDILTYTIVVPVLPYRLQEMGYTNVSGLTAWLLFAYSAGIFVFTFPIAYFFHRHPYRRAPLVAAVIILELSLVLFMLAKPYWTMVVSRFLQGAASTVVWSVGFALICENVEEENVGRQIGFAMAGVSIGSTIAPPIGGALYDSLGWHAPFVFCIIVCAIDLILRLFVLERADIRRFYEKRLGLEAGALKPRIVDGEVVTPKHASLPDNSFMQLTTAEKEKLSGVELTPWQVLVALGRSGRGMTSLLTMFCFGLIMGSTEPTLTLRVQSLWDKSSDFVGLVYLAAAAPTFFCGPIVGALADKYGAEWIMVPSMIFALPWLPLLLLKKSLAGFIVFFALANLLVSAAMSPTGLEVTMVSRSVPGISEIHQFSAMNIAFAISTAIGTIAGGQMYDHLQNGWAAVIWFSFASAVAIIPLQFFFSGNISLYRRLFDRKAVRERDIEERDSAANDGGRDKKAANGQMSPESTMRPRV